MREILFRGKDIDGKWVEGYYIVDEMDENKAYIGYVFGSDGRQPHDTDIVMVDKSTVCQYTGLTDRNGKKIFEGDIITYQHDNDDCPFPNKDTKRRVGRVYFQEFRSCFAVAEGKNGSAMINQDLFKYVQNGNRVEVIGNIFDNPELIGEQP